MLHPSPPQDQRDTPTPAHTTPPATAIPALADRARIADPPDSHGKVRKSRVRTAVRYYTSYREDIDERIAANQQTAREAEAAWQAEQDLLRGTDRAS